MIGYVTSADVTKASAAAYELSRPGLEHEGRWRAFRGSGATALFLLALQLPMLATATGRMDSEVYVPAVVPARLSLVVDLGMIAAYTLVAFRALELMWAVRCSAGTRRTAYVAFGAVCLGAALDVMEDATLWVRESGAVDRADMETAWSWPMRILVVAALAVLVAIAVRSKQLLKERTPREEHSPRAKRDETREPDAHPQETARNGLPRLTIERGRFDNARPDLVIACSGGGVRSASFCLGALQVLNKTGHYQRADAVVGVSGGGYIAAAFHAARWRSTSDPEDQETWSKEIGRDVFSQSSPEEHWLRRNTRYLLKTREVALQGLLSLLFGMAINVLLLTALVLGIAWVLGWYVNASGAVTGWDTPDARALQFQGRAWSWVGYVWLVPALALAPFLLEKFLDRFRTVHFRERQTLRRWTNALLVWGLVATVALLGVPLALAGLHDFTTGSGSAWAQLLQALGFASKEACEAALAVDNTACGVDRANLTTTPSPLWFGTGSLVALVAAVLAVVRSVTSPNGGVAGHGNANWLRKAFAKVWGMTKHLVVPWLAAVVVVAVLALALLRVTAALVDSPILLASWGTIYVFAIALLLVRILTDANRTSLHHFYRERLSYAYLVRRRSGLVAPINYEEPLRFSASAPPVERGPRLVSCAVANVTDSDVVPEKRGCTPFVFDDGRIGLTDHLLPPGAASVASVMYEYAADRLHRDATIPAAMAMSGAAFSPLAGRMTGRLAPYRFVLALGNARLGVWLPNPLWVDDLAVAKFLVKARRVDDVVDAWKQLRPAQRERLCNELLSRKDWGWLHHTLASRLPGEEVPTGLAVAQPVQDQRSLAVMVCRFLEGGHNVVSKPGPYRLMKEAVGSTSIYDRKLYITDGGHYDNLGLIEALRRRPKEIIVLDASADAEDTFEALGTAIATARMDLDCEVSFDPRAMKSVSTDERAVMAWGKGSYRYPNGATGDIWLAKVVMTDGLPWDVESYATRNATFPRTSTGNQLYGEFDLEAYRVLGREVTRRMVRDAQAEATEKTPLSAEVPEKPVGTKAAQVTSGPTVGATAVALFAAIARELREFETHRRARSQPSKHVGTPGRPPQPPSHPLR